MSARICNSVSFKLGAWTVLMWGTLAAAGCAQESPLEPNVYTLPDEQTLQQEALYMKQIFEQSGAQEQLGFIQFDLSDDQQYRFLVHRLLESGNTQENSPRLFAGVEQMRAAHLKVRRGSNVDEVNDVRSASQALSGNPCGQFIESPVGVANGQSQIVANSHVNCFNGGAFPYGYTDVTVYETDAAHSYLTAKAYQYLETYTGVGDVITPAAVSNLPVNAGKHHFVDGIMYVEDGSGNAYSTYASFGTQAANVPPTIKISHPMNFNGGINSSTRSCIKRAVYLGNNDCDYAAVDVAGNPSQTAVGMAKMSYINNQWRADTNPTNRWFPISGFSQFNNLYVPLAGVYDAGTNEAGDGCLISGFNSARAVMTFQSPNGGWCINKKDDNAPTSYAVSTQIFDNIKDKKGSQTASYNVLGDFGYDCLKLATNSANTVPVKIMVTISANASNTSNCGENRSQSLPIKNLDFKDSCFPKGTGILRSDGRYVSVEEIMIGEKVIATSNGMALTVTSMSRGGEDRPLVQVSDSAGHSVLLTETHPVVTSMGIVQASALTTGAIIETEDGFASITALEHVPYDDMVYNLSLGTAEEVAHVGAENRTMFAGGIRVGDNEMQFDMQKGEAAMQKDVATEWQRDFESDLARGANVAAP